MKSTLCVTNNTLLRLYGLTSEYTIWECFYLKMTRERDRTDELDYKELLSVVPVDRIHRRPSRNVQYVSDFQIERLFLLLPQQRHRRFPLKHKNLPVQNCALNGRKQNTNIRYLWRRSRWHRRPSEPARRRLAGWPRETRSGNSRCP